jgi:hypothetical protein
LGGNWEARGELDFGGCEGEWKLDGEASSEEGGRDRNLSMYIQGMGLDIEMVFYWHMYSIRIEINIRWIFFFTHK